jgi:hypothetical protein
MLVGVDMAHAIFVEPNHTVARGQIGPRGRFPRRSMEIEPAEDLIAGGYRLRKIMVVNS